MNRDEIAAELDGDYTDADAIEDAAAEAVAYRVGTDRAGRIDSDYDPDAEPCFAAIHAIAGNVATPRAVDLTPTCTKTGEPCPPECGTSVIVACFEPTTPIGQFDPDDHAPPKIARSGRSFDFAGYRVRLEAGAGDTRVEEIVAFIVGAINAKLGGAS